MSFDVRSWPLAEINSAGSWLISASEADLQTLLHISGTLDVLVIRYTSQRIKNELGSDQCSK